MSELRQRFKCCIIGDYGVGKTSMVRSLFGESTSDVQTTVGIDFFSKTILVDDVNVYLNLWDTAGAERYQSLMHSYLNGSDIIIIVYDITDPNAMLRVPHWLRQIENVRPSVVAIVGNKKDLSPTTTHAIRDTLEPYSRQQWKFITGVCSSRHRLSVQKIFRRCLRLMVKPVKDTISASTIIRLHTNKSKPAQKCCT